MHYVSAQGVDERAINVHSSSSYYYYYYSVPAVLREHAVCLNSSLCSLKACLKNFDPIIPSRLSTGMWKSPQNSQQCL